MSLSAVDKILNPGNNIRERITERIADKSTSWTDRIIRSMGRNKTTEGFQCATTVYPYIIDNTRVLVYENGLETKDPNNYSQLKKFAKDNKFEIKEDARSSNQGCKVRTPYGENYANAVSCQ